MAREKCDPEPEAILELFDHAGVGIEKGVVNERPSRLGLFRLGYAAVMLPDWSTSSVMVGRNRRWKHAPTRKLEPWQRHLVDSQCRPS